MRVADEVDARQRQQPRVKHRFDGRLASVGIDASVHQRGVDLGVGDAVAIEEREQGL